MKLEREIKEMKEEIAVCERILDEAGIKHRMV